MKYVQWFCFSITPFSIPSPPLNYRGFFSQENYDEEIEAYKHHLEQTYKLCRPCQTAVEYYIKYQNRQLRTVLLNHQLRRSRESDKAFLKVCITVISQWQKEMSLNLWETQEDCKFLSTCRLMRCYEMPSCFGTYVLRYCLICINSQ